MSPKLTDTQIKDSDTGEAIRNEQGVEFKPRVPPGPTMQENLSSTARGYNQRSEPLSRIDVPYSC